MGRSFTSKMFKGSRTSATVRAVARGRSPQRAWNIAVGRTVMRPLGRKFYK